MRNIWILLAIAPLSTTLGWVEALPVHAQSSGYLCFMKDSSGRVIDLSASVCGTQTIPTQPKPVAKTPQSPAVKPTNPTDQFWQNFSQRIKDPTMAQTAAILGQSTITEMAQTVCQSLKNGEPLPDPKTQASATRYPASLFDAINASAVESLCPDQKQKPKAATPSS